MRDLFSLPLSLLITAPGLPALSLRCHSSNAAFLAFSLAQELALFGDVLHDYCADCGRSNPLLWSLELTEVKLGQVEHFLRARK